MLLVKCRSACRANLSKVSADELDMDKLLEMFELELSARERAGSSIAPHTHNCSCPQERTPTSLRYGVKASPVTVRNLKHENDSSCCTKVKASGLGHKVKLKTALSFVSCWCTQFKLYTTQ